MKNQHLYNIYKVGYTKILFRVLYVKIELKYCFNQSSFNLCSCGELKYKNTRLLNNNVNLLVTPRLISTLVVL